MDKTKKRIVWIDLLRVIGVIGVILLHVVSNTINTFGNLSHNSHIVYVFIQYISSFAVPLFVMISGMMFLSKDVLTYKEMFKKYLLKIIMVINMKNKIPYILILTLLLVLAGCIIYKVKKM